MSLNPCQPGAGVGCACCCGVCSTTRDRATIADRLRARSQALLGVSAQAFGEAAARFKVEREGWERPGGPLAHCALAGFLGADERGVGCVGHASVTGGADRRDLGNFGAFTCEGFQCPSVGVLTDEEIGLARDGCGEWYLYGLVVTDVVFLRACLEAVRLAAGRRLALGAGWTPQVQRALRTLFELKLGSLPFGTGPEPGWDVGTLARAVATAMEEAEARDGQPGRG